MVSSLGYSLVGRSVEIYVRSSVDFWTSLTDAAWLHSPRNASSEQPSPISLVPVKKKRGRKSKKELAEMRRATVRTQLGV